MLLMWASGARHRIGVAERGNDFALTLPVAARAGRRALRRPFGRGARGVRRRSGARSATRTLCGRRLSPGAGTWIRRRGSVSSPRTASWGIWQPELYLTPAELEERGSAMARGAWPRVEWPVDRRWPTHRERVGRRPVAILARRALRRGARPDPVTVSGSRRSSSSVRRKTGAHGADRRRAGVSVEAHGPLARDDGGGRDRRRGLHRRYLGDPHRVGVRQAGRGHVRPGPRRALRPLWHGRARGLDDRRSRSSRWTWRQCWRCCESVVAESAAARSVTALFFRA